MPIIICSLIITIWRSKKKRKEGKERVHKSQLIAALSWLISYIVLAIFPLETHFLPLSILYQQLKLIITLPLLSFLQQLLLVQWKTAILKRRRQTVVYVRRRRKSEDEKTIKKKMRKEKKKKKKPNTGTIDWRLIKFFSTQNHNVLMKAEK